MKNSLIIAMGIFLMWTGLCFAGEDADHICFHRVDANADGDVTLKEFAVHYGKDEKRFKHADADGDGRLTHDEYHEALGHGSTDEADEK